MVALVFKHFLLISITNNIENSTCREYNLLAGKRESFLSVLAYSTDLCFCNNVLFQLVSYRKGILS